jgi:hypothetical protein
MGAAAGQVASSRFPIGTISAENRPNHRASCAAQQQAAHQSAISDMSGRGGEGSQRRTVGDRAQQSDAVIKRDPPAHTRRPREPRNSS